MPHMFIWGFAIILFFKCSILPATAEPERVHTGFYLMNLYELNINEHTFYADFYVWLRWHGSRDATLVEFVNAVEKWGVTQTPFNDTIITLPDGANYYGMRIEGRFYHAFDMQRFPLDTHQLDIQMENTEYPADSLIYIADSTVSAYIRPSFSMPGWHIDHCSISEKRHEYPTNFGRTDEKIADYSDCYFTLHIARPVNYFLFKLLLPLLVVVLSSIGALLIFPSYIEGRVSLPIGGLLTAVFLQQSYADALPDVGYMVLMDKIYLLCYALIAIVTWQVIVAGNYVRKHKRDESIINKVVQKEKWIAVALLILFLVGVNLLIAWL